MSTPTIKLSRQDAKDWIGELELNGLRVEELQADKSNESFVEQLYRVRNDNDQLSILFVSRSDKDFDMLIFMPTDYSRQLSKRIVNVLTEKS